MFYDLTKEGDEIPDPTPLAIPAHVKFIERDHIRDIIRQELSRHAQQEDFETWEESDDFDCDDDYDPTSPYEEQFDPDSGRSLWDTDYVGISSEADPQVGETALSDGAQGPSVSPGERAEITPESGGAQ